MFTLHQTPIFAKWRIGLRGMQARGAIAKRLTLLQAGHFGDAKSVGSGVSELRIHSGPGYRVYFVKRGTEIIILLCGGDKGSQARDIKQAQNLVQEIDDETDNL